MDGMSLDLESQLEGLDFSSIANGIDLSNLNIGMPNIDIASLLSGIKVDFSSDKMKEMFQSLLDSYQEYANQDPSTAWDTLPEAVQEYFETEEAQQILTDGIMEIIAYVGEEKITDAEITAFATKVLLGYETYLATHDTEGQASEETIAAYLQTDEARALIRSAVTDLIAKLSAASIPLRSMA